ncbi:MAG: thiamine ABC transporter ATP-binding protein [Hyphomicrobiaceae bacterium]
MTPAIQIKDVRFRYEDMDMRFDLEVAAGRFLAVIGPSGAGKSTLLNLIAGFEVPLGGEIALMGRPAAGVSPSERPVTIVFQEHNLFPHLDVWANVALGRATHLKLDAAGEEAVRKALARVGLLGFERRRPKELSGGERQRVALARCLVRERPILLLDEPFAALGPALRRDMLELLTALWREQKLTVVLVSHDPDDARRAATDVAFVHAGRILRHGSVHQVLDATDLPELTEYLGRPL